MSKDFLQRLLEFPCAFTMERANRVAEARLNYIKDDVTKDDAQDYSSEEKMRYKNLLTWVEHRLGNVSRAIQLNKDVLRATGYRNISALAARIHLCKCDKRKMEISLKKLEKMKRREQFNDLLIEAYAEQAYYYSRLGSFWHFNLSIELYNKAIQMCPKRYLWIFGLGLVNRRLSYFHMQAFYPTGDVKKYVKDADRLLRQVAEEGDSIELRCQAYSQLAVLYSSNAKELRLISGREKTQFYVDKLLKESGVLTPSVLNQSAKGMMDFQVDQSIKLLQKSIQKKTTSVAHLLLAKCKRIKIKTILKRKDSPKYPKQNYQNTENEIEMYNSALENCETSYNLSNETYVPALLTSMKLCFTLKDFDKARTIFKHIIDNENTHIDHLPTLRDAHDIVSQCQADLEMSNEHKTKAISLAADLISSNPNLNACRQKMWESIPSGSTADVNIENTHCKFFIKLIIKHQDVEVVQDFLKSIVDHNNFKDTLQKYLKSKAFENALAFLNLVNTHALRESQMCSRNDFQNLSERTYLLASRNRLERKAKDSKRPFQQMFKLVYGHCTGDQWDQSDHQKGDALLVSEGPKDTMTLCSNLKLVFDIVFGLDANIISWANWTIPEEGEDIILEEIKTFSVVIIVLGQSSREFESMLTKTNGITGVEFRVIKLHEQCQVPESLQSYPRFEVTDLGLHYDGHVKPDRVSVLEMFNDQFNGVIKLFKFVVKEWRHESSACIPPCGELPSVPPGDATPVEAEKKRRRRRRRGKRRKALSNN